MPQLPNELQGKTFVLRLLTPDGLDPRVFMVSTQFEHVVFGATVLGNSGAPEGSRPVVEVWTQGHPTPDFIMETQIFGPFGQKSSSCDSCENKDECPDSKAKTSCKTQKSDKPDGLKPDVGIADILLEAFDAMNGKKNGGDK